VLAFAAVAFRPAVVLDLRLIAVLPPESGLPLHPDAIISTNIAAGRAVRKTTCMPAHLSLRFIGWFLMRRSRLSGGSLMFVKKR